MGLGVTKFIYHLFLIQNSRVWLQFPSSAVFSWGHLVCMGFITARRRQRATGKGLNLPASTCEAGSQIKISLDLLNL